MLSLVLLGVALGVVLANAAVVGYAVHVRREKKRRIRAAVALFEALR